MNLCLKTNCVGMYLMAEILCAKACTTCGKDVEVAPEQGRRDWDVDHQPKWKDRDLNGMDRKQVSDEYNKDVRLRCPSCTVVHYVRDPKTGELKDFTFKKNSDDSTNLKSWGNDPAAPPSIQDH